MLTCGCRPVFVAEANMVTPLAEVKARACSCCGAKPGKKCAGGSARSVPATKDHGAFNYVDVCPARLEVQGALCLMAGRTPIERSSRV